MLGVLTRQNATLATNHIHHLPFFDFIVIRLVSIIWLRLGKFIVSRFSSNCGPRGETRLITLRRALFILEALEIDNPVDRMA